MRFTRAFMTSVALATAFASQTVSASQSVTVTNGVTVIRGNSDLKTTEDRPETYEDRETLERAGVTVFRGSATPYFQESPATDAKLDKIIKSGENLWIYDPQTGEVVACDLQNTIYGNRVVRCTTN